MGRQRRFASSADRQAAYRLRSKAASAWRRGDFAGWRDLKERARALELVRERVKSWAELVTEWGKV